MILARLTSDPLIKLFGRELLLVEEIPSEEGTRFSIAEKLPPDLREHCSHYFLEQEEFESLGHLADEDYARQVIEDFFFRHAEVISSEGYYAYYKQLLDPAKTAYEKALATAIIATHAPKVDDWDFENIVKDVNGFLASIQELETKDTEVPVNESLNIAQKYKQLNNYSGNIWEIIDNLGYHIGDSLSLLTYSLNARELKEIRIASERIADQAQRLLAETKALKAEVQSIIEQAQNETQTQTAA